MQLQHVPGTRCFFEKIRLVSAGDCTVFWRQLKWTFSHLLILSCHFRNPQKGGKELRSYHFTIGVCIIYDSGVYHVTGTQICKHTCVSNASMYCMYLLLGYLWVTYGVKYHTPICPFPGLRVHGYLELMADQICASFWKQNQHNKETLKEHNSILPKMEQLMKHQIYCWYHSSDRLINVQEQVLQRQFPVSSKRFINFNKQPKKRSTPHRENHRMSVVP